MYIAKLLLTSTLDARDLDMEYRFNMVYVYFRVLPITPSGPSGLFVSVFWKKEVSTYLLHLTQHIPILGLNGRYVPSEPHDLILPLLQFEN